MTTCIFVVGPTGVGKSFLCNKIFQTCGNHTTSFVSSSSIQSTTKEIQSGTFNYNGKTYTLLDFPGIYDVSTSETNNSKAQVDAENTCKMIKALQNCINVSAIIFCYTGPRFPMPLKVWYDRIRGIISRYPNLNILLLENKCNEEESLQLYTERNLELHRMLGFPPNASTVPYARFKYCFSGMDAGNDVHSLLNKIHTWLPINVSAPVVPEICYTGITEGPVFEEVISQTTKDEGQMITTSRQEPYLVERMVWAGGLGKVLGKKKLVQEWRQRTVTEQIWSPNMVTYREVVQYKNVHKLRFDGTKDFYQKVEVNRKTHRVGAQSQTCRTQ